MRALLSWVVGATPRKSAIGLELSCAALNAKRGIKARVEAGRLWVRFSRFPSAQILARPVQPSFVRRHAVAMLTDGQRERVHSVKCWRTSIIAAESLPISCFSQDLEAQLREARASAPTALRQS